MAFSVSGTVTSGLGKGEVFVALEGYAFQFREKLGYEPYPGTLNVDVGESIRSRFESVDHVVIDGWTDGDRSFGNVYCYPASVVGESAGVPLHVIVPERTDHDPSTVELLSPLDLRERFDLSDGSGFEIQVESYETLET